MHLVLLTHRIDHPSLRAEQLSAREWSKLSDRAAGFMKLQLFWSMRAKLMGISEAVAQPHNARSRDTTDLQ